MASVILNRRPVSVTIISFLLIATGAGGFLSHLAGFRAQGFLQNDFIWISLVSLTAMFCGVYMLRAGNWARWLSIAWIAFHVILSVFHSRLQLAVHILVFAAFAYFLFRPRASEYFRGAGSNGTCS
jgi:hypothetical protein